MEDLDLDERPLLAGNQDQPKMIYALIRDDILSGRLPPNTRLVARTLAETYGTSTNPVREALQQLRGEGFVVITPNRGARVRPMDDDFIRDILEIAILVEPFLTRRFVDVATDEEIAKLEHIQARIEELNFTDADAYTELDSQFHQIMYDRHYNRHIVDLWWKHREILSALARDIVFARWRKAAVLAEHRALIDCVKRHDADGAAAVIETHIRGSGQHLSEQVRARPHR
jgi:DNA-binding GntR family transcriptional regulator